MSDYLDEDEKPKSRLISYNYQFCINEKQAYILQVQVYDHEMTEGEFKSKMIYQANYFTYICEQLMKKNNEKNLHLFFSYFSLYYRICTEC